jgi:type IV secretion system protein VirD4
MSQQQWGPRPGGPAPPRPIRKRRVPVGVWIICGLLATIGLLISSYSPRLSLILTAPLIITLALLIISALSAQGMASRTRKNNEKASRRWAATRPEYLISASADPLAKAREVTIQSGGSLVLGVTPDYREWRTVQRNHGLLVLGPPQSGKTSGLIVPAVLAFSGAVVSTATKIDVLSATAASRSRYGRVWLFDPAGEEIIPPGVHELRWTPISGSSTWDGARSMARAMVDATLRDVGSGEEVHFADLAAKYLATLLHAAALHAETTIEDVRHWVAATEFRAPVGILSATAASIHPRRRGASLALDDLSRIFYTDLRERSSISSTTSRVLDAYGSEAVISRCKLPNFDPDDFVRSAETIYITAPARHQAMVAPLIVGLLEEIKEAIYRLNREQPLATSRRSPVLFALDEAANIAPIRHLDKYVSEGGGQGLQIMACFQDLSQARARWGDDVGKGFLSLFASKAIFPGIGDLDTLQALSTMVGDWDRPYTTVDYSQGQTRTRSFGFDGGISEGTTWGQNVGYSTQREQFLSKSEISNIPAGCVLTIRAGQWGLVEIMKFFERSPWREIIAQNQLVLPYCPPAVLARKELPDLLPLSDLLTERNKGANPDTEGRASN